MEWAEGNEKSYADDYIATTKILRESEVYKAMGSYFSVSTMGHRGRHGVQSDRPIVHIDVGCGVGDALGEMSKFLTEMPEGKNHILIGVDVNQYMCRAAVERLMSDGHVVEEYVHQERRIRSKKRKLIMDRSFPIFQQEIESMDLTPNGRIVILQDDIRKSSSVLSTILGELAKRHNVRHVDSISFAQPGLSGEAASAGKPIEDIVQFRSSGKERGKATAAFIHDVSDAVTTRAKQLLGKGGTYATVNRLDNNDRLKEMFTKITGQEFPADDDDQGQTFARMVVASLATRKAGEYFRPSMGAVLYPNYQELERQTPIKYASFSPTSTSVNFQYKDRSYDLFALSSLRQDLHPLKSNPSLIRMNFSSKGKKAGDQ